MTFYISAKTAVMNNHGSVKNTINTVDNTTDREAITISMNDNEILTADTLQDIFSAEKDTRILSPRQQHMIKALADQPETMISILKENPSLINSLVVFFKHEELNITNLYERRYPDQKISFDDFVARNPLRIRMQKIKKTLAENGIDTSLTQNQQNLLSQRKQNLQKITDKGNKELAQQDDQQKAAREQNEVLLSEQNQKEREETDLQRAQEGEIVTNNIHQNLNTLHNTVYNTVHNNPKTAFKHLDVMNLSSHRSKIIQEPTIRLRPRTKMRRQDSINKYINTLSGSENKLSQQLYTMSENRKYRDLFLHSLSQQKKK